MNQELMLQASMIERQIQELQQNLQFIDKEISELQVFSRNLNDLQSSNEKQILASLGKGIHAKAELKDKDLFVEVGSGVTVKKTPKETQEVIDNQIKKLGEARLHFLEKIEVNHQTLHNLVDEIEQSKNKD